MLVDNDTNIGMSNNKMSWRIHKNQSIIRYDYTEDHINWKTGVIDNSWYASDFVTPVNLITTGARIHWIGFYCAFNSGANLLYIQAAIYSDLDVSDNTNYLALDFTKMKNAGYYTLPNEQFILMASINQTTRDYLCFSYSDGKVYVSASANGNYRIQAIIPCIKQ